MLIIGLGHQARQGKDSLAAWLIKFYEQFNVKVVRAAFADELKKEVLANVRDRILMEYGERFRPFPFLQAQRVQLVVQALCFERNLPYDQEPDMSDPLCPYGKQRVLLQWWGTEFRRAQDQDYWVNRLDQHIRGLDAQVVIVTDMRFPNERKFIKDKHGLTVNVNRHNYGTSTPQHSSEISLQPYHYDHQIHARDLNELYLLGLEVIHPAVMRRLS